jgi:predicted outer membrane repeat protein
LKLSVNSNYYRGKQDEHCCISDNKCGMIRGALSLFMGVQFYIVTSGIAGTILSACTNSGKGRTGGVMKRVLCLVLAALALFSVNSSAATWYIKPDGTGDAATIQAGINAAAPGDSILLADGTFTGSGNRDVDYLGKAITVCSESDIPANCVIDCQGSEPDEHRGFIFQSGEGAGSVLKGIKIVNGYIYYNLEYGGAIYCDNSSPSITNCEFENNFAVGGGGAIYCDSTSSSITECTFVSNDVVGLGGALRLSSLSSLEIADCTFSLNTASSGGGAAISALSSSTIRDCTFSENQATFDGGGLYLHPGCIVTGCTFSGNTASRDGGGVWALNDTASIMNSTFSANESDRLGSALFCKGISATVEYCTIYHNQNNDASYGGGTIAVLPYLGSPSSMTISHCTLYLNFSYGYGGTPGIYNEDSGLVLEYTIISGNLDLVSGPFGQIVNCNGGSVSMSCCDIWGNTHNYEYGCIAGLNGVDGNIGAEPMFCDANNQDFHLTAGSSCLGGTCGQMGAFGLGCRAAVPHILGITDIGNDQGGQLRLTWVGSVYDAPGDTIDVTGYAVYRKQGAYLAEQLIPASPRGPMLDGWDYIATIPARGDSVYQYIAPTLCDSTDVLGICWSEFFVSAMTEDPLVYWDSSPERGYSIDNLAPGIPEGMSVAYNTGSGNHVSWEPSEDEDLQYYRIYRDSDPDFDPGPGTLEETTHETMWSDAEYDGWSMYYKVTAVDFAGNESEAASPGVTTGDETSPLPRTFALYQNAPNPFNPFTTITFDIPRPVQVRLSIYNVKGERINVLVDHMMSEGRKEVGWDGTDDNGERVSSGVYFYRLVAGDYTQNRKMILLR